MSYRLCSVSFNFHRNIMPKGPKNRVPSSTDLHHETRQEAEQGRPPGTLSSPSHQPPSGRCPSSYHQITLLPLFELEHKQIVCSLVSWLFKNSQYYVCEIYPSCMNLSILRMNCKFLKPPMDYKICVHIDIYVCMYFYLYIYTHTYTYPVYIHV